MFDNLRETTCIIEVPKGRNLNKGVQKDFFRDFPEVLMLDAFQIIWRGVAEKRFAFSPFLFNVDIAGLL